MSKVVQVSASFTRPSDTTAYADVDLVANSTTAGSVTPMQFSFGVGNGRGLKILGGKIQKSDGTDVANATFTLHLFGSSPTVANGDNGALSTDTAARIGSIAFPIMLGYTDDARTQVAVGDQTGGINPLHHYLRSTNSIYGLLEAKAAYTPASAEVFTVTLDVEQS